jgi:hypothetical protein
MLPNNFVFTLLHNRVVKKWYQKEMGQTKTFNWLKQEVLAKQLNELNYHYQDETPVTEVIFLVIW